MNKNLEEKREEEVVNLRLLEVVSSKNYEKGLYVDIHV
jgi:hypothetical protein